MMILSPLSARFRIWSCCWALVGALFAAATSAELRAEEGDLSSKLAAATRRAANEVYDLRYKFVPGETLRWKVVHLATTETTIQGNTQTSQSRSTSIKVWKVTDVSPDGNATFVHMVSEADMWKKISGRPEERYNSKSDKTPPPDYEAAAETIGKPLATITVDPQGNVVQRDDHHGKKLAHGQVMPPLPEGPVRLGQEWFAPDEVIVRLPDRRVERIKTRQQYRLESVQTGVATISIDTQVLTPVDNPKVRSQLLQQITEGTMKFDVDAGRLISKELEWDETVIGFNGPESILKFLARGTEELLETEHVAGPSSPAVTPATPQAAGPSLPATTSSRKGVLQSVVVQPSNDIKPANGTKPTDGEPSRAETAGPVAATANSDVPQVRRRDGDPIYRR